MPTELEDGWFYQFCSCRDCPLMQRQRREDVGLFWLNGEPRCKCGTPYENMGINRHGIDIFDADDRIRVDRAKGRLAQWPTDSTMHIAAASDAAMPGPAYDAPAALDWPRAGQPSSLRSDRKKDD